MTPPEAISKPPSSTSVPLKEWTEDRLSSVWHELKEVRGMASEAKKKVNERACLHEKDIDGLIVAVNSWRNIKFAAAISFAVLAAGAIAQYYALETKTDDTAASIESVEESVKAIEQDVQRVSVVFEEHVAQHDRERQGRVENEELQRKRLRAVVVEAMAEMTANQNRRGNR